MGPWDLYQALRAEYPALTALTPIVLGAIVGFGVGWFALNQRLATYKAKLEHAQEVVDGKLPASTYKPIRFRKERPVLIGIVLAGIGLLFVGAGLGFIVANFKSVSPLQSTNEALKDAKKTPTAADGPLVWFVNLTMEGGPLTGNNVFTLQFRGMNKSKDEVKIKEAEIISSVDGTHLPLEIVADKEIIPITDINPLPPGSPITLVAKFGPPNPNAPGKIFGLDATAFLERWRHFTFKVVDDVTKYEILYDETSISPFFPNMVGPRVSKKDSPSK